MVLFWYHVVAVSQIVQRKSGSHNPGGILNRLLWGNLCSCEMNSGILLLNVVVGKVRFLQSILHKLLLLITTILWCLTGYFQFCNTICTWLLIDIGVQIIELIDIWNVNCKAFSFYSAHSCWDLWRVDFLTQMWWFSWKMWVSFFYREVVIIFRSCAYSESDVDTCRGACACKCACHCYQLDVQCLAMNFTGFTIFWEGKVMMGTGDLWIMIKYVTVDVEILLMRVNEIIL